MILYKMVHSSTSLFCVAFPTSWLPLVGTLMWDSAHELFPRWNNLTFLSRRNLKPIPKYTQYPNSDIVQDGLLFYFSILSRFSDFSAPSCSYSYVRLRARALPLLKQSSLLFPDMQRTAPVLRAHLEEEEEVAAEGQRMPASDFEFGDQKVATCCG